MAVKIEEASTITESGRITVPKAVREVLGIQPGDKIVFRIEDERVTLDCFTAEHRDPAVESFLKVLESDIAQGRRIRDLPASVVASLRRAGGQVSVDPNKPLDGDVDL